MPIKMALLYSLVLIFVLTGCSTDEKSSGVPEKTDEKSEENTSDTTNKFDGDGGFLWKVNHGETSVYILGSIHLGHKDYYPLSDEIEEAYASSNTILPEINMFEVNMTEEEIKKMALFKNGQTLDEVLSEDAYNQLSKIFEENGVELESLHDYEPWYIETILSGFLQKESDFSPEQGVDLYFLKRALKDNKEIVELETVEGQYKMLTGFSLNTQVDKLETFIGSYEEKAEGLNKLGYQWIQGNTKKGRKEVKELLSDEFESYGDAFKQKMNDDRNLGMANKINDILQKNNGQTYFAVIGTAHAVIEPSVPSLLKEKGYDIERVY